jgi:hypothetical protein
MTDMEPEIMGMGFAYRGAAALARRAYSMLRPQHGRN